ncbi:hypothetical protein KQX64_06720 [Rhodopseudomonas palustris]|nr:hypothetical protein KQX64_06720 [Rhodopseudomonas palustris]
MKEKANKIATCAKAATSNILAQECVASALDPEQKQFVTCAAKAQSASAAAMCLDAVSPEAAKIRGMLECIDRTPPSSRGSCFGPVIGGDAGRIATCIAVPDQDRIALAKCVLGNKPEVRAAERVFRCVSGGTDSSALLANCSEGILDAKTGQVASCVVKAGGDRTQLAACGANAVLPPTRLAWSVALVVLRGQPASRFALLGR